jgi:hypothetical protein
VIHAGQESNAASSEYVIPSSGATRAKACRHAERKHEFQVVWWHLNCGNTAEQTFAAPNDSRGPKRTQDRDTRSPPGRRSPTGCRSSASGICRSSWRGTRRTATDGNSSQPPAPPNPAGPPRRRPLPEADQAPARPRRPPQRFRANHIEAQVKPRGRVMEPHRTTILVSLPSSPPAPVSLSPPLASGAH